MRASIVSNKSIQSSGQRNQPQTQFITPISSTEKSSINRQSAQAALTSHSKSKSELIFINNSDLSNQRPKKSRIPKDDVKSKRHIEQDEDKPM